MGVRDELRLTAAQKRWLHELVSQDCAMKVPAGTANALLGSGLAAPFGASGLWQATDSARDLVARWERQEAFDLALTERPSGSYDYARRIGEWMRAIGDYRHLDPWWQHLCGQHAEAIAALRFARRDPLPSGDVHGETHDWVVDRVDTAIRTLADLDAAKDRAGANGSVAISFEVLSRPAPRPSVEARHAAARTDGTVSLDRYRDRRPKPATSRPTGAA